MVFKLVKYFGLLNCCYNFNAYKWCIMVYISKSYYHWGAGCCNKN